MKYIIDFIDTLTANEINAYCAGANIELIKQFSTFGNVFLCESATEPELDPQIESIVQDSENAISLLGTTIHFDDTQLTRPFSIEDEKNWWKIASLNSVDFDKDIADVKVRGITSTIYLLDSGIERDHPEFDEANIKLLHSFTDTFDDTTGHGTALASVMVGRTCSLTNAELKVVKIFEKGVGTLQSDMLGALDAVLADYLANNKKPAVVNLSWAISQNDYIDAKIQRLINEGMHVVASAGNNGVPIGSVTPASIPDVFTIGAFNQELEPSDFSNYTGESIISYTGSETNNGALDAWAPGEQIWAAGLNGTYGYVAGTSVAATIMSACIAYNLEQLSDSNGHLYNDMFTVEHQLAGGNGKYGSLALAPGGMLDLSDPKYSSSTNRIAQYDNASVARGLGFLIILEEETSYTRTFISTVTTESAVSKEDLPDYAQINESGFLVINAPKLGKGEVVKSLPIIEFDLYQRDGSISSIEAEIVVTAKGLDATTAPLFLPEGDRYLDLILQFTDPGCIDNPCRSTVGCDAGCFEFGKDCVCLD